MTEIVFILDRSGSMAGLEKDTIGGFNSMLDKQRKLSGNAVVSTILFDNQSEVIHDRIKINDVANLTEKKYYARGTTALLDAVGGSIHHIGNIHKYARKEDVPEKTIFIIITDGLENASRYYTYDKVKQMIERQKKLYDWEFLFLGANIDAVKEAEKFGIDELKSVNYNCDSYGMALNYKVLNKTIGFMRTGESLSRDWKKEIEDDYKKRGDKQ
ncbi:MAG: vWA domain-containing protein [Erysipelotrichia bacterium]|nr:vWA domain-containing protein [Erysipelotrichia bacterium]